MFTRIFNSRFIVLSQTVLRRGHNVKCFNNYNINQKPPNLNRLIKCKYSTSATKVTPNEENEDEDELIYSGAISSQVKFVKTFSLTTSMLAIMCQPIIYNKSLELGGTSIMVAVCGVVGFFTFVTPFLLHFVSKKYVVTLDYNSKAKTYTATLVRFFPFPRRVKFTADDIHVPDVPGVFTTFIAKGVPMFVDLNQMRRPEHIAKIMGYDKPFTFDIEVPSSEIKENKK